MKNRKTVPFLFLEMRGDKIKGFFAILAVISLLMLCFIPSIGYSQKDRVEELIQELKDKYFGAREEAAKTLGKIKDTRAVEPLIAALKDKSSVVRGAVAMALGEIKDVRAVEPSITALKDKSSDVRGTVAWALGEIKDSRAVEPLIISLKDKDGLAHWEITKALNKIDPQWRTSEAAKRAAELFIAALKDDDCNVREGAAMALGEIKDVRAVEPLITALKDKSSDVRYQATLVLEKMKDAIGVEHLQPLLAELKNPNSVTRIGAAKTLGEIGHTGAINPLIASLADENANVRKEVARALIMIGAQTDETFGVRMVDNTGLQGIYFSRKAWVKGKVKDTRIVKVLSESLKNRDAVVVAGAYPFFIRNGEKGSESILVEALESFGDELMAFDFLNCGNDRLRNAAKNWAVKKGYTIKQWQDSGGTGPIWGSRQ